MGARAGGPGGRGEGRHGDPSGCGRARCRRAASVRRAARRGVRRDGGRGGGGWRRVAGCADCRRGSHAVTSARPTPEERGAEGERLVSAELRRLAPQFGFSMVESVLLTPGMRTSQIDHIVVDSNGILVVETKAWSARVFGRDTEPRWTLRYPSGKTFQVQNPLHQNTSHVDSVRQVLRASAHPIDPDYVKGVVVLVGTDTDRLELDSLSKERIRDVASLEAYFADRRDFAINSGGLSERAIGELTGLLAGLNRAGDSEVEARHAVGRRPAVKRWESSSVRPTRPSESVAVQPSVSPSRHAPADSADTTSAATPRPGGSEMTRSLTAPARP
ncbi:MAG: NERD domain-containing protein, partial [Actinobacteria bacterium]